MKQHEPVAEWSGVSRDEVEARVASGPWLLYFYSRSYCATDCTAVAALARAHEGVGVAELCPDRHPSWAGAFPRLPVVRVFADGALVAEREGGPLSREVLDELVAEVLAR